MAVDRRRALTWGINLVLAFSFAWLSFYQLLQYEKWFIIFTFLLSFLASLYFVRRTAGEIGTYIRAHPKIALVLALAALVLIEAMHHVKGVPNLQLQFGSLPFRFFRLRWWLLCAPALFYLLVWVWQKSSGFLAKLWAELTPGQRRFYLIATMGSATVILLAYMINPQWYLQFDTVYSIDSGWCYQSIFPQLSYYDIRHPTLSIVTFPIWALLQYTLRLFVPGQLLDVLCAACIQIVNVQFLLLIGLIIGKLAKSRWVSLLYFASSPVLLYTMFFEKYQICTFLLVLYAYRLCTEEKNAGGNLALAVGAMPTSIFLFVYEALLKEPWLAKLKRLCRTALQGVGFLICAGRIHLLNPATLLAEVHHMAQGFGLKNLPVQECLISWSKMVQGSFLGLSSVKDTHYIWSDLTSRVSLVGIVILACILVGIIANWRDHFSRICTIWTFSALVLFVAFQWSVHESPLFSIYFSWALIPLFQKGLQLWIDKFRWPEKIVYPVIFILMLAVNVLNIVDIGLFLA